VRVEVVKISPAQWAEHCAHNAHLACFGEILPPEFERIDFALLAVATQTNTPVSYMTLRELDRESVYLKHGGAFDPARGTVMVLESYQAMIRHLDERYVRQSTLVLNTNIPYLKLAMAVGFRIVGIRFFKGEIYCELLRTKETEQ
jgi:hypothetical protein